MRAYPSGAFEPAYSIVSVIAHLEQFAANGKGGAGEFSHLRQMRAIEHWAADKERFWLESSVLGGMNHYGVSPIRLSKEV
jgi:hypothetical protein